MSVNVTLRLGLVPHNWEEARFEIRKVMGKSTISECRVRGSLPTILSTHKTGPQIHCHSCGGDSTLFVYIWGDRLTTGRNTGTWQLGRGHHFRRWEEGDWPTHLSFQFNLLVKLHPFTKRKIPRGWRKAGGNGLVWGAAPSQPCGPGTLEAEMR